MNGELPTQLRFQDFPLAYRRCFEVHRALFQLGFLEPEMMAEVIDEQLVAILKTQGRVLRISVADIPGQDREDALATYIALLRVVHELRPEQRDTIWRKSPLSKNGTKGKLSPFNLLLKAVMKHWIMPPVTAGRMDHLWGDGPPADHPIEAKFSMIEMLKETH